MTRKLIYFILFLVCYYLFFRKFTLWDSKRTNLNTIRTWNYNGIVYKKDTVKEEHGAVKLRFNDFSIGEMTFYEDGFEFIKLGDSVIKLENETEIRVFREKKEYKFYPIFYDKIEYKK